MQAINMLQAKSSLSRLVEAIEQGREREIVIARNGRPAAKLVPMNAAPSEKRIGVAKGRFVVPDDIDAFRFSFTGRRKSTRSGARPRPRKKRRRGAERATPFSGGRPDRRGLRKHASMAVRDILRMGDPRLLEIARPVTDFATPALHELIADMFDTMAAAGGVGLAAPQIGVGLQVVIFGFEESERYPDAEPVPQTILVNPRITPLTGTEELGWEGCLSVPGLRGEVPRFARIRYQGCDPQGRAIDRTVEGFHARVVQHECDHLVGKLYPMRMRDFSRFGFTDVLFPELA